MQMDLIISPVNVTAEAVAVAGLWWWRQQLQQRGSEGGKFGSTLLYVHRNHNDYQGRGAQDGHLDFHTAPELCRGGWLVECYFTSTETV